MIKKAFTLTEVLITLSIVGVIAVLTLPNLIGNTNSKSNALILKSTYQQFGDALKQAMNDQGVRSILDLDYEGDSNSEKLSMFLNKYFDVVKDCGGSTDCFADFYKNYAGSEAANIFKYNDNEMIKYVKLSNGAVLALRMDLVGGDAGSNALVIDVNGKSKPNTLGLDIFAVGINEDGSLGSGVLGSDTASQCIAGGSANSAEQCFIVLQARNWDIEGYLKENNE